MRRTPLKLCPACGSDYVGIVELLPSESHRNTYTTFHVECRSCYFCGPQPPFPQTRDGAVQAWDRS